jgi:predicted small lipoprotein YifL
MGQQQKILVKAHALGARAVTACGGLVLASLLFGCGQRGPLTLPDDSAFKQRATLPDIVRRQLPERPNASPNPTHSDPTPPSANATAPAPSQPASGTQPTAGHR